MADLIFGIIFLFATGIAIGGIITDEDFHHPFFILVAVSMFLWSTATIYNGTVKTKNNTAVEALNGTLEYDTVSLDKNGMLLEIKIK